MINIILIVILWIIIGIWICYKLDWTLDPIVDFNISILACILIVVFMPIAFILTVIHFYCVKKWEE